MSYGSVLSLAAQSSRWEQAMNVKLVEMAAAAEKAAAMQIDAADHQALAVEAEEQAATEQAEAAELQEEAAVLLEKSEADSAIAAGEQVEVEELEAQGAAEEEQSVAHGAAAALDETTFDGAMAEATTDAIEAARSEAQAHGEEIGIGFCQFVIFLDFACDIIGAISAVGMEGFAASEAVKASAELASATATKAEEEREATLAAELQAKAVEDASAAAELQTDEAAQAELAEEERVAGEEKEAEADALLEQAEVEEETAAEEETLSAEQEEDTGSLAAESVVKGVLSCWDAIMASLFGVVSFLFFSFRSISKVVPHAVATFAWARNPSAAAATNGSGGALCRDLSYNIHHGAIFTLMAGMFSNLFNVMDQTSLQARGGIVLGFALAGACIQTILLHMLPGHLSRSQNIGGIFLNGARFLITLSVLYTLEMLILWATFGQRIFQIEWLRGLDNWIWWVVFLAPFGVHLWYLEIPLLKRRRGANYGAWTRNEEEAGNHATEADALLPTKHVETDARATGYETKGWFALLRQDLARMQLPFEILIMACMLGLLFHCIASAVTLWPASKALLLSTRPDWLVPLAVVVCILAALGGIGLSIWSKRTNNAAK
jgi:chemotaxis protein histidine kinase CheA